MGLDEAIRRLRESVIARDARAVPDTLSGVTKQRIEIVLRAIDRFTDDQRDVVFALLDDNQGNWFPGASSLAKFCDGASTAHIASHVGILQRGQRKLDREGRDYWLKPMWEIGAIEKVFFDSSTSTFIAGHPIPKSSNCAYRLSEGFRAVLQAPEGHWQSLLTAWMHEDEARRRLELQAQVAQAAIHGVDRKHGDLIAACRDYYAPHFLSGYEVLYIDEGDGDRITVDQRNRLAEAGIHLGLGDSMPDILLWNRATDYLWVIEAVTSDGEADMHKVRNLGDLASRCGKQGVGFTTAYPTWRVAASRQSKMKNLANQTFLWIQEDPAKHFHAEHFVPRSDDAIA